MIDCAFHSSDGFVAALAVESKMLEDPCHLSTSSGKKAVATSAGPLERCQTDCCRMIGWEWHDF